MEFAVELIEFLAERRQEGIAGCNADMLATALIAWVLTGHAAETLVDIKNEKNADDKFRALVEFMKCHGAEIEAAADRCCEVLTEYYNTAIQ